jgi:enoyl-CoA hydratase/carnithine racemase
MPASLEIAGRVARLVLRGEGGNLIDRRTLNDIASACDRLSRDASISVLLLLGEGDDFCAGWQPGLRDELLSSHPDDPSTIDPFAPLAGLRQPVIVAVQGRASSAGLELALACDIRIAAQDARFAQPEPAEGLLPLAGGSQRLPRIAGRGAALAMLLLGEELDAAGALRAGLVSRVVPRDSLRAEAGRLAERIASRGPLALGYAKEAVHQGLEMSLAQGLNYEVDLSIILQTTRDRAEGVRAFLEKRPPHFEGR